MIFKKVIFLILLLVPFVAADITTLDQIKDTYNWGDPLELTTTVIQKEDTKGLLKSEVTCEDIQLDYYVLPVDLKKNTREEFQIPTFSFEDPLIDQCSLEIILETQTGELIERKTLKEFTVTNDLVVFTTLDNLETLPGSTIKITGEARKESGEDLTEGIALILLDGNEVDSVVMEDSSFSSKIELDGSIDSLTHTVTVQVSDNSENEGQESIDFYITPVPTTLNILINNNSEGTFNPGEDVHIRAQLFDQAGALIDNTAEIVVEDPKRKTVIEGLTQLEISLDQFAPPGEWKISAKQDAVIDEKTFTINTLRTILPELTGEGISLRNIGNVKFNDNIEFILNDIRIFKELSLDINESKTISLLDEVEDGNYTLTVVILENAYDLGSIEILDKRNPIKRAISPLTGNVIGATGGLFSFFSSAITYFISGIVVGLVLFYYYRRKKTEYRLKHDKVAGPLKKQKTQESTRPIMVKETSTEKSSSENKDNKGDSGLFSMFD